MTGGAGCLVGGPPHVFAPGGPDNGLSGHPQKAAGHGLPPDLPA